MTDMLLLVQVVGQQADVSLPRTLFSSLASNIQEAKDKVDLGAYKPPKFSEAENWGTEHPPPPPVRLLLSWNHIHDISASAYCIACRTAG